MVSNMTRVSASPPRTLSFTLRRKRQIQCLNVDLFVDMDGRDTTHFKSSSLAHLVGRSIDCLFVRSIRWTFKRLYNYDAIESHKPIFNESALYKVIQNRLKSVSGQKLISFLICVYFFNFLEMKTFSEAKEIHRKLIAVNYTLLSLLVFFSSFSFKRKAPFSRQTDIHESLEEKFRAVFIVQNRNSSIESHIMLSSEKYRLWR